MKTEIESLKEEIERLKTLNSILEEEMSDIEGSYRSYMVDGHNRYKTLDAMEQKVYLKALVMQMMISVDCAKVRKERFLTTGENPKFEDTMKNVLNNIEGTK